MDHYVAALAPRFGHVLAGLAGAGLQRVYNVGNFAGTGLASLRQSAYFVCDNCKAAALFAGPGCLDCGIECQQVGLLSDILDHVKKAADGVNILA
ncbi:hypothetical protein D3C86_1845960 [compost metagenome]